MRHLLSVMLREIQRASQPEIGEFQVVEITDEDVAAFEVAMDQLPFVHVVEPVEDLLDQALDSRFGEVHLEGGREGGREGGVKHE
jgi:hypothetical protein